MPFSINFIYKIIFSCNKNIIKTIYYFIYTFLKYICILQKCFNMQYVIYSINRRSPSVASNVQCPIHCPSIVRHIIHCSSNVPRGFGPLRVLIHHICLTLEPSNSMGCFSCEPVPFPGPSR